MSTHAFSISEALRFGWRTTKKHFLFFVQVILIMALISYGPAVIMGQFDQVDLPTAAFIYFVIAIIVFWFIQLLLQIGVIQIVLGHVDGKRVGVEDLFTGARSLIPYFLSIIVSVLAQFIAMVLVSVLVLLLSFTLGMLLVFVFNASENLFYIGVPVLYIFNILAGFAVVVVLMVRWQFALFLIIDRHKGPIEALVESWRLTRGVFWRLILFWLASIGVILAGLLAFGIGLLWAVPTTTLAMGWVYRRLSHKAHA